MDFLPFPFFAIVASAFICLLGAVLALNVFGLPANWIILCLAFLWKLACPGATNLGFTFWKILIFLALCGELLEFFLQIIKARRYGSSSSGTWAGMFGAILGAILMAPLFWGIGALIGALLGAWTGCYLMEITRGRPPREALDAAFGAMLGRFLGTVCKIGIGGAMIVVIASHIWPEAPALPSVPSEEVTIVQHKLPSFFHAC